MPWNDLASSECDFLKCLQSQLSDVLIPNINAPTLDNLTKCRSLLPPSDPNYVSASARESARKQQAQITENMQAQIEAAKAYQAAQAQKSARRQQQSQHMIRGPKFNAWDAWLKLLARPPSMLGPLRMVVDCYRAQCALGVQVRKVGRLHGKAVGQVGLVDKHMNVLLRDARYEYTANRGEPKKWVRCVEQLPMLWIKGDSVVLFFRVSS
jgi:small nuclear ribonucleoprotein (snRNP)-like protein